MDALIRRQNEDRRTVHQIRVQRHGRDKGDRLTEQRLPLQLIQRARGERQPARRQGTSPLFLRRAGAHRRVRFGK